jgi:hypothetical protein
MQGSGVTLAIGEGTDGVALNPTVNNPNAMSGINHVCFTIEGFDVDRVMAILIDNGFEPIENGIPALIKPLTCRVRLRQRANNGGGPTSPSGTPELYFTDPAAPAHTLFMPAGWSSPVRPRALQRARQRHWLGAGGGAGLTRRALET